MRILILLLGILFVPFFCWSDTITFDLNTTYSGTPPNGSAPWLTAQFQDIGTNLVQLTLTATNLNGNEDVDHWGFNTDPGLDSQLASLTFAHVSGQTAISTGASADAFKEGPSHGYDIQFDWGEGANSVFRSGVNSVYDLSGISGLSADSFDFASQGGGGGGSFFSAAHVQNTGSSYNGSAWIGSTGAAVPEPENVSLLLAGLVFAGQALRRRALRPRKSI